MDRYHLAWLGVGRPSTGVRGRAMTTVEETAYVREVAAAKLAVLRLSLSAVERDGMPFLGETHLSVRSGSGRAGARTADREDRRDDPGDEGANLHDADLGHEPLQERRGGEPLGKGARGLGQDGHGNEPGQEQAEEPGGDGEDERRQHA